MEKEAIPVAKISDDLPAEVKNESTETNSLLPARPPISKNQLKKMKKRELDLPKRMEKRKKEREARKARGKGNLCTIERANGETVEVHRKSLKKNLMANSSNRLRVVIDCSFEELMSDPDISHLAKQLTFCYGANRRALAPLQFYATSLMSKSKTSEVLTKSGLPSWDIHRHEQHYLDVFAAEPKENLCYLSSESPNELTDFDESKVYIIGGLVDHNHHKSLCYDLAVKHGIMHYRLPINKFMHMKTRMVLTVNQVFEIICKFTEVKDWQQAFIGCLPKRKGAEIKAGENEEEEEESQDEDEEERKSKPKKANLCKEPTDLSKTESATSSLELKSVDK